MSVFYINDTNSQLKDIKTFLSKLSEIKIIGLDTETTGLDPFTSQLLLAQIYIEGDIYILNRGGLGRKFFVNLIRMINDKRITCVGHNIKFDYKMLLSDTGEKLKNVYDTMVVESVIRAGIGDKFYSLKTLVLKYCGVELTKDDRLEFISLNQESVFSDQQLNYAATDVLYLIDIVNKQRDDYKEARLDRTINLEMELLPTVADMEYEGISLDVDHWKKLTEAAEKMSEECGTRTKELIFSSMDTSKFENALTLADSLAIPVKTKRDRTALESITDLSVAMQWVREKFNTESPKQLTAALNLSGVKTSSTNEKVLNKLAKNDIIDSLLEYRAFQKQVSTYGYNIIDLINPVTGRIHTEYNQVGAKARFSSSNPNLQSIPIEGGYREGFVSRPGYSFVSLDYSQQEFRLAGAISKEPKIIEAYLKGSDMHTATAAIRFDKKLEEVSKSERNVGKTLNFAVIYGTTAWGLKRNFNTSIEESEKMLEDYWAGYPKLAAFKNAAEDKIWKLGYSVTLNGRRRYFRPAPAFATPKELDKLYGKTKREGFNFIIQGTAADVTKIAMVDMDKNNPFGNDLFHILLQIHDEILAEVRDDLIDAAIEYMSGIMKRAFQPFLGEIPACVDYKSSKMWTKG